MREGDSLLLINVIFPAFLPKIICSLLNLLYFCSKYLIKD